VITLVGRRSFPVQLTREDFEIQQSKVPRRARFFYMLCDTKDAEFMFAATDQRNDWRLERARRENADRAMQAHG
jgi:hypothetical protein